MMSAHIVMLLTGLLVGGCIGFLLHRSDYCMAGMFRDLFLFRSSRMLKSFVLFFALALVLFELILATGLVAFPFPKYGPPSGINLVGGFLFGIGMVLAGGCAIGTLYKMGAGRFSSLLAFVGMIAGSLLFALQYPQLKVLMHVLDLPTSAITLPELLQVPSWLGVCIVLLPTGALLYRWYRCGSMLKPAVVEGYLQPWKTAVALALLASLFLMIMGLPMGVTTSNAKFGAVLMQLLAPEQYAATPFFTKLSFEYQPPLGGGVIRGGAGADLDGVALVQYPLIIGIIAGSAFSAIRLGEWKLHLRLPWRQVLSAIIGGTMMGFASRIAPSCNLWHLFGGLPVLGLQSILFLAGLIAGAWVGGLLFTRLVVPR